MSCLCVLLFGATYNASAQTTSTQSTSNPTTTIDVWREGLAGTEQPTPGATTTMTINDDGEVVVPGEDVVAKLTDLEHRWADAVMRQSKANLSRLLSSDFLFISEHANPSAASVSKQSYVNRVVKEPQAKVEKFNVQTIRVYGDTAIVNVRYLPVAIGKVAPVEIIVTDVWVKRNNRWQAVTRHTSELKAAPPQAAQ
ncbi:MAG: nuclear transport factor 2 family protein [Pyrinomonadaceae bacterium MAG19_C2-C3]|nr:nuclear transport factor 2 family protein [Pyrinomonadaceae bacterium MAG19_C2-C3]